MVAADAVCSAVAAVTAMVRVVVEVAAEAAAGRARAEAVVRWAASGRADTGIVGTRSTERICKMNRRSRDWKSTTIDSRVGRRLAGWSGS